VEATGSSGSAARNAFSLIERRPDIREAEQVMVAANAEVGVAKAQFFPQIALTGSGGGSFGRSSAFSSLMGSQIGIWSYGAQVSQPIFTGGAFAEICVQPSRNINRP